VTGDGRTWVRRDPQGFDLIEADALRPTSAYSGNLYSLEYFTLLRESLRPGGFAVTWLPTQRVRSTFLRSFPHVIAVRDIAIGSDAPIRFDRSIYTDVNRDLFAKDEFMVRAKGGWAPRGVRRFGGELRLRDAIRWANPP
jgi:hypothetical protein